MKIERILVPTDFADHSEIALEHATELARQFGAEIHLLHAYSISPGGVAPFGVDLTPDLSGTLRGAAAEQLGKICARLSETGQKVEMHLSPDVPSAAIVDTARELEIDLIVIGARGLTGLKHGILGSVAERTVRHAPCPVLTVGHSPGDSKSAEREKE